MIYLCYTKMCECSVSVMCIHLCYGNMCECSVSVMCIHLCYGSMCKCSVALEPWQLPHTQPGGSSVFHTLILRANM